MRALGRALFATWIPQVVQILRGGCPTEGTFCAMGSSGGANLERGLAPDPTGGGHMGGSTLSIDYGGPQPPTSGFA